MITTLLIFHGLIGVALLGVLTHQAVALLRRRNGRTASFVSRYTHVSPTIFSGAAVCLYLLQVLIGAIIYPSYRINVRIPFEEMNLAWAVGVFELKEHLAGIGLGTLPLYAASWNSEDITYQRMRRVLTLMLCVIVWWDFLVGHVLNNIRGLA